jgi:hypothetical protein
MIVFLCSVIIVLTLPGSCFSIGLIKLVSFSLVEIVRIPYNAKNLNTAYEHHLNKSSILAETITNSVYFFLLVGGN